LLNNREKRSNYRPGVGARNREVKWVKWNAAEAIATPPKSETFDPEIVIVVGRQHEKLVDDNIPPFFRSI
jgi:hypothetical protein